MKLREWEPETARLIIRNAYERSGRRLDKDHVNAEEALDWSMEEAEDRADS